MADEPMPALDYEDQPIVGGVVCRRAAGVLTIRIRRSAAALWQGVLVGGAGVAFLILTLVAIFAGGMSTWVLWGMLGIGGFLLAGASFVARGLSPVVITVDDERLTLRSRDLLEIHTGELARGTIADVRVIRLPFQDTVLRPHAVVAVGRDGQQHQLTLASRAEARYVADVLRETLNLPPERWPEVGYPPRPWFSRVTRAIDPFGVTLTLSPSLVPAWFFAATPLLVGASILIAARVLDRAEPSRWDGWFFVWATAYFAMMSVALLAIANRLRTRHTLTISPTTLALREVGLRPGNEAWSASEVADVCPRRRGWRRPHIEAIFRDGQRVTLFPRVPRRDVEWVCASARRALQLSHGNLN